LQLIFEFKDFQSLQQRLSERAAFKKCCDWPIPLSGMGPVGRQIQALVEQVNRAKDQTEGHQSATSSQSDIFI